MKPHEREWLDYAWGVVACGRGHADRCEDAGGKGVSGDTTARFPGFVAPGYEPSRGVLCMAHVHRYLPDRDDVPGGRLADINSAILRWRQRGRGPESDATFLTEATPAYMTSAAEWPWWKKHFKPVLDEGRVPMDEVAFANFAKCRTETEGDDDASMRLARLCAETYPPAALIRTLRPLAVLVASLQLDLGDVGDVMVIRWNGRTRQDETGSSKETWVRLKGGRLRTLRS